MKDFAPVDTDTYPVAKKSFKLHDRPVIGFHYYYDPKQDRNILISVASDSVKTWAASSFGDELDLMPLQEYSNIRCGSQAYDIHPDGKCIIVVDTMNVLHVINEDENGTLNGTIIDEGLMQILFCRFAPHKDLIFSINFVQGLQTFDLEGKNPVRKDFKEKISVSAVNFSPNGKYLALGYVSGFVEIRDGETWDLLCSIEGAHAKKIRVVQFSNDEQKLLIGSDDKTLTSHAIMEVASTKLKTFLYHTAPVLAATFNYAADSSQFASSSADQKVILWDTNSGDALQVFQKCYEEQVITAINFSHNGRYLFSGTANGQIVVHKISSVYEESIPDVEMIETKEEVEIIEETFIDESLQISEDEREEDNVGAALENVDISDSEEELEEEKEPQEEAPASPAETPNGNISVSVTPSPAAAVPQSPPLSPDDGFDETKELLEEEAGDVPMSPDE